MGNSESTTWDRYVPPDQEGNDDQQQAQANSNKTPAKVKQQTKENTDDNKPKQKTKPNADDGKEKPKAKPNKTDEKEKKQPKTEKQGSSKKDKKTKDKDNEPDAENTEETDRTTSAKNKGLQRPQMIRGVGHRNFDDELEYDPMANFLDKKDLDKEWSKVTDDVYIDGVGPQVLARKKPRGPRWKPKTPVGSEHGIEPKALPERDNSKQFSDQITGPVSRPQMKIGINEFIMDKTDKYSLHGNFVLDPVKPNGNFIT